MLISIFVNKEKKVKEKFGDLVKKYRGERSLKVLGDELGISAAYISDIEKGNRLPSKNIVDKLVKCFNLQSKEKDAFYDLVAQESPNQYKVSNDIAEYIIKNELLREFIRKAQKQQVDKSYWKKIIKELEIIGG